IASCVKAEFIRVNVLTGVMDTDQGLIEGRAHQLLRYRRELGSDVKILEEIRTAGFGADCVSGNEVKRAIECGFTPSSVAFAGVGKSDAEIRYALQSDIFCFNCESLPEMEVINQIAGSMTKKARVALRINPNVHANTHHYITTGLEENKFGIAFEDALQAYRIAHELPNIEVTGIDCHIGSQLLDDAPLLEALDKVIELADQLHAAGIRLHHLDIGGGIGITYDNEQPVAVADYLARLFKRIDHWRADSYGGAPISIMFEPGRSIVGNAGVLLTRVEYLKHGASKNFAVVDAAMNDLMRPAMYEAWHGVQAVQQRDIAARQYDVVGPVCESGDWLARDRALALEPGDLLAIMSAGAYGMTMASNYNTRGRAAEVLVDGSSFSVIRRRENPKDLFALESIVE
ncbi:MAG: hypothetical protein RLZ64_1078, partial [Pseudomonadota bacterium]